MVSPARPSMLRPTVAVAIALLLSGRAASAAPRPDFAAKLPVRAGDWKKPAMPVPYDRKSLYDYIDGGAELYLAFGFQGAITFEYSAGADDEIKVDLFDMGSPAGAFGVFAHGRESIASEVGQGSEYSAGLLTFWKHRWFVSLLGYPETPAKRKAVYELAHAIAALISETGRPPAIVGALPKPGLVEASVRTFHHPLLQNDYVTLSQDNPLGIGEKTDAVLARYVRPDERHVLMVVDYPSVADAQKAERALVSDVLGGATVARHGERFAGIKRSAKRIIVVLDAQSKAIATRVLAEVP
jgi:hypothetical protein